MIDLSLPWQVIEGDCLALLPECQRSCADALVSDPPYGMKWNTDSTRFTGGAGRRGSPGRAWQPIHGDDTPFDPAPWIDFPEVVLWGANHYAQRLPVGTTLVWVKKAPENFGTFLSDAEVAWMKGGHGVYCFERTWSNTERTMNATRTAYHPTEKPVTLMHWCLQRLDLPPNALILDPYCGSGSTGVAAVQMGHRFIGIEREPAYVAIARQRIADAAAQGNLFADGAA